MVDYVEIIDGKTWTFELHEGFVHLSSLRTSDIRTSWLRPGSIWEKDAAFWDEDPEWMSGSEREPTVPPDLMRRAVEHFRKQIRFRKWADEFWPS